MRLTLVIPLLVACSGQVEVGYNLLPGGGAANGGEGPLGGGGEGNVLVLAGGGGVSGASSAPSVCEPVSCRGTIYACGNCKDDDEDGLFDASDPDCLGPCDDSEDSFGRDAPSTASCRLDCYFDRNRGGGDDSCLWNHACDELSVAPDFPPSGSRSCAFDAKLTVSGFSCEQLLEEQPEVCTESCLPITPNGCDCFGCCELPAGSGVTVFLGSQESQTRCSSANLDACQPCTQVPSCMNACDACEVCVGKPHPEAGCQGAAPCPGGAPACGSALDCGANAYCITGCCVDIPR